MNHDLLKVAIARRKALLDEVACIDDFLKTAAAMKTAAVRNGSTLPLWEYLGVDRGGSARTYRPAEIVAIAEQILLAAGRPLTRGELHDRLLAVGAQISGDDPVKNLGTILWRSRRFDNTGRTYWIASVPRPAMAVGED